MNWMLWAALVSYLAMAGYLVWAMFDLSFACVSKMAMAFLACAMGSVFLICGAVSFLGSLGH